MNFSSVMALVIDHQPKMLQMFASLKKKETNGFELNGLVWKLLKTIKVVSIQPDDIAIVFLVDAVCIVDP